MLNIVLTDTDATDHLVEGAVAGSSTDTPPEESEDDDLGGLVNTDARVNEALQRAQTLDIAPSQ